MSRAGPVLALLLVATSGNAATVFWDNNFSSSGAQGGTGTWTSTATNWWNGTRNTRFATRDSIVFGGVAGVVTLGGSFTATSLRVDTSGYVFDVPSSRTLTVTNGLAGSGDFSKTGAGLITAAGTGDFSGVATIHQGTLRLDSRLALGTGTIRLGTNNPTLTLRADANTTFGNNVEVDGSGTITASRLTTAGGTDRRLDLGDIRIYDTRALTINNGNSFSLGARNLDLQGAASLTVNGGSGLFVTGNYSDSTAARITLGSATTTNRASRGFQLQNGVSTTVKARITVSGSGGASLGASGTGTELVYTANLTADGTSADTYVTVNQGGRVNFGDLARVDTSRLPNSHRPFRIVGDGTGVVTFSPGFISNPSADVGINSVRVGNATWVTQSTNHLGMAFVAFDIENGALWKAQGDAQRFAGAVNVNRNATLETIANLTLTGVVSSDNATRILAKSGNGTLTLAGTTANTFSGTLRVDAGTMSMEKNGALGSATNLILNPGTTLTLGGASTVTNRIRDSLRLTLSDVTIRADGIRETLGPLAVGVDGLSIDLSGSGSTRLTFGNSLSQAWDGELLIQNWSNGSDGRGVDQILFTGGLTQDQLDLVAFQNPNGTGLFVPADLLPNGELVPLIPVPEPASAILLAAGLLALCSHRLHRSSRRL